ncbi:MAG TPA: DegT/DnrJ/EryC1/StrS family aminotransferase [Candidatus Coprenecus pullistercoris]|nr:DegT/DnrJ/EryC1/StrS family aminotransferase [Candidatus Coprenecus pullistercoris]
MQEQQKIQMVDLHGQYMRIKAEVDAAIAEVIDSSAFINGPAVGRFASALAQYTGAGHVITCGNGTDALQIALMALGLRPGDEVIVPAFTYVASAEVIALLGLKPVMVDVDRDTFNTDMRFIEKAHTPRTRAIIPVHLFGQSCDMEPIMDFASAHGLYVVEDNAQSLGAEYIYRDGKRRRTGAVGHIGCTSFFPSKNLGCYGDGGALFTDDDALAERIRMTANHGQRVKYHHDVIGCNSRLDTIQAAVLEVKLRYLDDYCGARRTAAHRYNALLRGVDGVELPVEAPYSTHVYHQYTLRVRDGRRNALKEFLASRGIPSMIYYPLPLYRQNAYLYDGSGLKIADELAASVLSLPMHTELEAVEQERIAEAIMDFFKR